MKRKLPSDDVLIVLGCDKHARPHDAPYPDVMAQYVRRVTREQGAIIAEFRSEAADVLRAFVDAERRCCGEIGWDVEEGDRLRLMITSTEERLDALGALFPGVTIETHQ